MIVFNKKGRKRAGSILVYVLMVLTITSILFSGFIQIISSQIQYSLKKVTREQSIQIAEAGVYYYRWYLAHQIEGKTKQQIQHFWQNESPLGVGSSYVADYEGAGEYSIRVTPPTGNSTIAIVESTGYTYKDPNATRTVRVRFRQPSWSEFAVLCDSDIRFGNGTTVDGPIHSNGGIRFDGVARNTVSSARTTYTDPDSGLVKDGVWTSWTGEYNTSMSSQVFLGGKVFPKTGPNFNGVTGDLAFMKSQAGCATAGSYCSDSTLNGNRYFNNVNYGRHITFNANGTMSVRRVTGVNSSTGDISAQSSAVNYTIPSDGVVFVEDDVWVDGRIDNIGITVVAADISGGTQKNIYLKNDLVYTRYDGSEGMGLIAQNNIDVIRNSEDNLRIDGALLAQNGRVGRPYYGFTDHRNTITIFGSIATRGRYGFAFTDGSGYTTRNLIFDNNFLYTPPPYFPTGTHYAIDLWEEL